ncbi:hypothetical protein K435DRAFT_811034 [Dendrothele bispora CBS 962.96]|uniref:DUF4100 domain-containing protein n=1 Tax=Dendrothele bispora (strain CBS 962.96) TaxID=1314807 RepID=A0A4S8KTI0_DENBC|nr:hypothetical protein K435DRAFT_811034 [Dendrothele bispora CBS 962.96]
MRPWNGSIISWIQNRDKTKRVRFDLDGQRIDPNEDKDTSTQNKKESSNPSSSSSVDDLAKHFKDMRIDQASMKTALNEITRALRRDSNPTLHSSQTNQPPYEILRRDYEGGVEAFLRRQQNTSSDFRREQPPHMGNQTSNSANVSNIELSYGGVDVFTSDVFAMSAPDSYDSSAYPTLRTGKDTSRRYDPKARPRTDDQAKSTRTPSSNRPPVPTPPQEPSTSTQRPPQLPAQKPIEVVPPNHPINREEGWKASKPSNNKGKEKEKEDVSMRDVTGKPGPSYHFTSTLSEKTDANEICNKIFDTQISIPIGHLIGVSPQLQKFVTEQTRTKREYKSKPAEYSYNFESSYEVEEEEYEPVYPSNVGVGNFEELPSFLVKYSNAVTTNPEKFYAMVTGKMEVTINGVSLTAMIDSGSELNLISRDVPDRVGLPIDFEGMKWTLRGVNGGPERLRGVVTDVPMMIGKHEFPHHHFVSNAQLESQDIILEWTILEKAKIYLWKDGDKSVPPTLNIPSVVSTSWTKRAFGETFDVSVAKRRYKPVDRKHRPVPTYMPNPEAQQFKRIPPPTPLKLPTRPIPYKQLKFGKRVTLECLEAMLAKIEPGILTPQEIDLLAFVVVSREEAFAFCYAEKIEEEEKAGRLLVLRTIRSLFWVRRSLG